MRNGYMIAEKVGARKKVDRGQVGWPTTESELTLREFYSWPTPATQRGWDSVGEVWPAQPSREGGVPPASHPVRIELVVDPAQARMLIELLHHLFAASPETPAPAAMGQSRTLPVRPAYDLTPREEEILEQMIEGKSNRQIGLQLAITTATVKSHVSNILSKMDAECRTEAVARVLQQKLREGSA